MKGRGAAAFFLFGVLAGSAAGQTQAKAKAVSESPLDFSGTWKLDEAASANVSPNMIGAILVVEQKGDHIRVTPAPQGAGKVRLAGDEIVVDGRPYEKSVGGAKGVLTARWSDDGKALELELSGTAPEKGRKMIQTVSWSLSADGSTWLRETRTAGEGRVRVTRLVFRRQKPEPPPTTKSAPPKPTKNPS